MLRTRVALVLQNGHVGTTHCADTTHQFGTSPTESETNGTAFDQKGTQASTEIASTTRTTGATRFASRGVVAGAGTTIDVTEFHTGTGRSSLSRSESD